MKINLRKADAIQKNVAAELSVIGTSTNVLIGQFKDPKEVILKAQIEFDEKVIKFLSLNTALYVIRRLAGEAATQAGINEILADRAEASRSIAFQSRIADQVVGMDEEELNKRFANFTKPVTSQWESRETSFNAGILSQETIDSAKSVVNKLRKTLRDSSDQLLNLNVKTQIQLDETTVGTLTKYGYI